MNFVYDDGGRAAAGFKGNAGDCVVRAIAIATGRPYREIYDHVAMMGRAERANKKGKRSQPGNGVFTRRKWFKDWMFLLGFKWTPTMGIGTGCRVHLHEGELPATGRLVVEVSRHVTAVVDGDIHDTWDPRREVHNSRSVCPEDPVKPGAWRWPDAPNVEHSISRRCVYGYYTYTKT